MVKAAEELRKRILRKDEDRKERECPLTDRGHTQNKVDAETRKNKVKEKEYAENLSSCLE